MNACVEACIGLGSNLDDPRQQVSTALKELRRLPYSQFKAESSLYRSGPMGPADQPDYVNAVAVVQTLLTPHALLDALLGIEQQHGRVRGATRWGPRTLDLDLLVYGDRLIEDARLRVPHPGIAERAFVVLPLSEVAPGLKVPGKGAIETLASQVERGGIQRLS